MNSTGALLVGLPTFAGLSEEDRETIGTRCGRRAIRAGETLIAEGAPSDTLHLVLFGRFDVMKAGQSAPIAAIGAGEPVGEIGFFAGLPRTATVIARRDSEVLTLAREDYAALVQQVPGLASTVLASLAGRLADATARAAPPESEPGRIVLLCGAGDAPVPAGFGAELAASIAPHADAIWIDRETCQRASGSDAPDGPEALHWLRRQEAAHRLVLLEVGREADRWTALAARHADALLLVAGKGEATARSPAERAVLDAIPPSARRLALLPEAGAASLPWLEGRDPAAHHFLTPPDGMKRLARFLAGTARGLVLGGGGALCGAHIGTVFALMDAGCRFEAFGGSSAGGAVAAAFAAEVPRAEMVAVVKDIFLTGGSFRKWTVPRHGLIDAGEFDARLRTHYGTRPIEDLPHPWFAMASDLSTNGPRRIETGPFWEAVRATCSIPALLPPFIDGEGRVLVDGGIVDNLPVGPMRARKHGPNLAVALALPDARPVRGRYADFPTRGRLLAETVLPFLRQRRGVPRLAPTLTRTMLLSSNARVHEAMAQADLALLPPSPKGMGILDWHRFELHEREAYDWASAWIEAQPEAALALFTGE